MSGWQFFLALLCIFLCLFMMLVILIQRGRGSGLAGAFGGGGGSSAFGAKTGDVLTWATVVIAFTFLLLTVVMNFKFDESPQAAVAAQPVELPTTLDLPLPSLDDLGGMTQITIPPAVATDDVPATAKQDGGGEPPTGSTSDGAKPETGTDQPGVTPGDQPAPGTPEGGQTPESFDDPEREE